MDSDPVTARSKRSTLMGLLTLLRLALLTPIYVWGALMALLAGATARGVRRVERTLWEWSATIYRYASVETARKWRDGC